MKLSIIIPTYNSSNFIYDCIESINNKTKKLDCEIYVIDNNSSDNTVSIVNKYFKNIHSIVNNKNYGYSVAVNKGILRAKGDFICVLNPDTTIISNAFEDLINYLKKKYFINYIIIMIYHLSM